jgi:hypothetical protein
MRSDIYTNKDRLDYILSETERLGKFCGLYPSDTGKLRLLAEEMLGLSVRLFENLNYEFFIERDEGKRFLLNLSADVFVNQSQKEKLLSLSVNGENRARKGLVGKISGIFEDLLIGNCEYERVYVPYYDGLGLTSYFSLTAYMENINETPLKSKEEQWDGLEKSIITTLTRDLVIGVRNRKVEMIAVIEF